MISPEFPEFYSRFFPQLPASTSVFCLASPKGLEPRSVTSICVESILAITLTSQILDNPCHCFSLFSCENCRASSSGQGKTACESEPGESCFTEAFRRSVWATRVLWQVGTKGKWKRRTRLQECPTPQLILTV